MGRNEGNQNSDAAEAAGLLLGMSFNVAGSVAITPSARQRTVLAKADADRWKNEEGP